jgi:hypothetical protein
VVPRAVFLRMKSPKVIEKKDKRAFIFNPSVETNQTITEFKLTDSDDGKAKAVVYENGTVNSSTDGHDVTLSPSVKSM